MSSDNKDMAIIRPLLAQTRLEGAQLKLAYDANKDGWNADTFHLKCKVHGWLVDIPYYEVMPKRLTLELHTLLISNHLITFLTVRDKRAGLVVAKTKEGAIVGGFNPDGKSTNDNCTYS